MMLGKSIGCMIGIFVVGRRKRACRRYEPIGFLERFWSAQALAARAKRTTLDDDKIVALVEAILSDSVSRSSTPVVVFTFQLPDRPENPLGATGVEQGGLHVQFARDVETAS